ncbi:response regulator transcription factor [Paraburkholderia terrae]
MTVLYSNCTSRINDGLSAAVLPPEFWCADLSFLKKSIGKLQPFKHDPRIDSVCEANKCCKSRTCTASDLFENIQQLHKTQLNCRSVRYPYVYRSSFLQRAGQTPRQCGNGVHRANPFRRPLDVPQTLPSLPIMNATRDFRIAIADDHPVIRHAVISALTGIPGFLVDAAVKSGKELLQLLSEGTWDLIITDLTMGTAQDDIDGLDLIARLRKRYPDIPVVVFTMLASDDVLSRVSRSGVAGIVDKREGIEEFRIAAREVMQHRRPYFSAKIRARLRRPDGDETNGGKSVLTKKEMNVIRLFASGASLTEIARQVNRSVSTVATQKSTAMKKLQLETNADLVKYSQVNGLI